MRVPALLCRALIVFGAAGLALFGVSVLALEPLRVQNLAWWLAFLTPLYGVGLLAYLHRSDLPIARLMLLNGSVWAGVGGVSHLVYGLWLAGPDEGWLWVLALPAFTLGSSTLVATATLIALYPDGRYRSLHERYAVRTLWLLIPLIAPALVVSHRRIPLDVEYDRASVPNPLYVPALDALRSISQVWAEFIGLAPVVALVVLVIGYRRADAEARRQMRWLLLVPIAAVGLVLAGLLVRATPLSGEWLDVAGVAAVYVVLGLFPVVMLVSILRHRLLDVDVIIRKSLVYGVLWMLIALAYLGTATAVGIAGSSRLPVTLAILLTVVATLVFQPARQALERLADRWVFGERLGGYALVGRLGAQLEATGDPSELLARLAVAVRAGLRLEWAEVVLRLRSEEGPIREVAAGSDARKERPDGAVAVYVTPLAYGGETLGAIECGPKLDGAFSADDEQVLVTLARQAALAVHNARLTTELAARLDDIQQQAAELSASRARIVAAGDAERRRIERDLHDGAQQQLVALMAGLRLARNQLARDPSGATAMLAELESEAASLHRDLVELTRGIHPPVLTDRGLAEAIESRTERLPLDVRVVVSPSVRAVRFPDEIEGAAYFVVSEALTNVLKHASAGCVVVRLDASGDRLTVEVADDGVGLNGSGQRGKGLDNMADRLEALGGQLRVSSNGPGSGTTVTAALPVVMGATRA